MYAAHFNLREPPFSIAPDPAFLYMSARHQEALGHLLYGTGQYGGFVQLTGEVGTSKTTIVRTLLSQKLGNVDVAMIHNPRQNELEFVASICDELGVAYPKPAESIKILVDALNEHLLRAHADGRRTVLIIDEAQNLTAKQMKTLITRCGPGSKMICLGNLAQIDTPYLSETTSGLTYVVDRFRGWPHGGHVTLARGERSRLAAYASDIL